jgi:hypothetical protein
MRFHSLVAILVLGSTVGCGRSITPPSASTTTGPVPASVPDDRTSEPAEADATPATRRQADVTVNDHLRQTPAEPSFAESSELDSFMPAVRPEWDEARMLQHSIRKIDGRHLTIYTDLPRQPAVEELPQIFDLAVPKWCEYFEIDESQVEDWICNAYLIGDRTRFREAGLLYEDLPPFQNGFARDVEIWIYDQPSDYYRRHLLLHEGTHGFMEWAFAGFGPPWYMEGTAELLATHQWRDGELKLSHFPQDRDETPYWGRIKVIREDSVANRGKRILEILQYDQRAHQDVEPYAWCWALATFLENGSKTQRLFRGLSRHANDEFTIFNDNLTSQLQADLPFLMHRWQHFASNLDYGFDIEREQITRSPPVSLDDQPCTFEILADRGWQSTGCQLEAGAEYAIRAEGRFELAQQPRTWWSEPNGITIRYHSGLPLGMLLGAIVDEGVAPEGTSPFVRPDSIGTGGQSKADRNGTLYLRINDFPSELADNAGSVRVTVQRISPPVPN